MKTLVQTKSAVARLVRTSLLGMALVLTTGPLLEAQPSVVKKWDTTVGAGKLTSSMPSWATANGGFLLGGSSLSDAGYDKTFSSYGDEDYWVIRLDASGNKVKDLILGGANNDELSSMVATADGGFLLGGYSLSDAGYDKSQNSLGGTDYWVVKFDANDNKVWDKTLGGADNDYLLSMVATADGGFLLGGSSRSDAGGDKSQDRRGNYYGYYDYDYWVVKIDANGNKVWDKTLGGKQG